MAERTDVSTEQQGAGASLLDIAVVLARHLRVLILLPLAAGALAYASTYAFGTKPLVFTASARALMAPQGAAPVEVYNGLLKSEAIAGRLVGRFSLQQAYGVSSEEQARGILASRTRIIPGRVIVVEVDDANPRLAADLAAAYVEELRQAARALAVTEAAHRRQVYEQHMQRLKESLDRAKRAPASGDKPLASKARIPDQVLADLRARVTAQEMRLATLPGTATESDVRLASRELAWLRGELASLDRNGPESERYRQALLDLVVEQYELARLDESNAEIQLLRDAGAPAARVTNPPRRALTTLAAIAGTLLFTALAVLALESLRREAADPEAARRLAQIKDSLRLWRGRQHR